MGKISFQGELGAYSHQACREAFPDHEVLPCSTFEGAIEAVHDGRAEIAMLAVENSTYGRVADVHHLLPESGLHIIAEHFVRVEIALLGVPGARLEEVRSVTSHPMLLGQCREFLKQHNIKRISGRDTAGAAQHIAKLGEPAQAALASKLAGEIYGLDLLAHGIEDHANNRTRFLAMRKQPVTLPNNEEIMTSFVFRVRNIPAALYKAMGGFATNGVNMVKLESYMLNGSFTATQFYADIEGHPDDPSVKRALEELGYFSSYLHILGSYPAHAMRQSG